MNTNIYRFPIKSPTALDVTPAEARIFLLHIRREVRKILAALDGHRQAARVSRRRAEKLRLQNGRFDGQRMAALEAQAGAADTACGPLTTALRECGEMLLSLAGPFDAGTTFGQRCDILEVNQADRAELLGDEGLLQIAGAYGLESSAFYGRSGWRNGPLHRALNAAAKHFLLNTPEGEKLLPEVFESATPGKSQEVVQLSRRLQIVAKSE